MATTPVPEAAHRAMARFHKASMTNPTEFVIHPATLARFKREEGTVAGARFGELLGLPYIADPNVDERVVRARSYVEHVIDDGFTRVEMFYVDQEIGPWG